MVLAFVTVLGASLTLGLGGSTPMILVSNIAGFVGLVLVQTAERVPAIKKRFLVGSKSTWLFLLILYLTPLLLFVPDLRDPRALLTLLGPLIMSNGFAVLAFGPTQDWLISRFQRRARGQTV